jgi:hypothetical protein
MVNSPPRLFSQREEFTIAEDEDPAARRKSHNREFEDNQQGLRTSIADSKRLMDEADGMIRRHREESDASGDHSKTRAKIDLPRHLLPRPREWLWRGTIRSAHDFLRLEEIVDLDLCILQAVGAMDAIRLDGFSEGLADRAVIGLFRVGGAHHFTIA